MRHIRLSCQRCGERSILFHKQHCHLFHFRGISIIIRVRLKNHLLPFIPLLHDVTSRADGILPVIFIIRMFRHNAHDCHCIGPDRKWFRHPKLHRILIERNRFIQHCKVINRTLFFAVIIRKCHIGGRQRLAICKLYTIPDRNCPYHTILTDAVIRRKIFAYLQILCRYCKCTLNQRLMHMLPCSPAKRRVKSCFRLRGNRHRNYNFIFCRHLTGRLCVLILISCTA